MELNKGPVIEPEISYHLRKEVDEQERIDKIVEMTDEQLKLKLLAERLFTMAELRVIKLTKHHTVKF